MRRGRGLLLHTEWVTQGWKKSKRWLPLWAAILLAVPVIGGTTGVVLSALDGSSSFWQLPLFGVFVYVWLMVALNRTEIEVDGDGAWVRTGPLFSGFEPERRIQRADVSRLWVRIQAGPKGATEYVACVEQAGGGWMDLLGPYWKQEQAAKVAAEVAETWGWPGEVTAEWRVKRNPRLGWVIVGWGTTILLGFIWAAVVEIYRIR